MSYKYAEPKQTVFEPLPAGEYDFTVIEVDQTTLTDKGNFMLPIKIQIKNTNNVIYDYPSAGKSAKDGKPYDTIAPLLKAIRRNPAVDEEPDFSSANLVGARGSVKLKVEEYEGTKRNKVSYYIYDREQTTATVSGGLDAKPKEYNQANAVSSVKTDENIPF